MVSSVPSPSDAASRTVLILYATREGHTRQVAEHVAATIQRRVQQGVGFATELRNVAQQPELPDVSGYAGVVLAASIHRGQHEAEMVRLIREHRAELDRVHTALLSVSLTQAGAVDPQAEPEQRARAQADVQASIDKLRSETGWRPGAVLSVAGALRYRQYNRLVRFIMKSIAGRAGLSTDVSRDHVYTDWAALDRFIERWLDRLFPPDRPESTPAHPVEPGR